MYLPVPETCNTYDRLPGDARHPQGLSERRWPTTMSIFPCARAKFMRWWGRTAPGKSTLMKILYGLEQPTSGEILINGQPVSISSPHKHCTGHRHGASELYAGAFIYGCPKRRAGQRAQTGRFVDERTAVPLPKSWPPDYGLDVEPLRPSKRRRWGCANASRS